MLRRRRRRAGTRPGRAISDVIYVGEVTRYIVDLDHGGQLMVMRQNLETTSEQVLEEQGRRVRLEWRPEHTFTIDGKGVSTNETQVETGQPCKARVVLLVAATAFLAAGCGGGGNSKTQNVRVGPADSRSARVRARST